MTRPGTDAGRRGTVLHVSPHPDDESIGAPATLMALRDAGWEIVNLACSLGAPEEQDRRLAELRAACAVAGFTLELLGQPTAGSTPVRDGLRTSASSLAQDDLTAALADALARHRPAVVVAPSPHDRHPGHEVVGRATLAAMRRGATAASVSVPPLWLWGLWADLPLPTLAVAFGPPRLEEVLRALDAHAGELRRNDYRKLVRGRAEMNASLGPERVFGFGHSAHDFPYLELLCEVVAAGDRWHLGHPRWLDPDAPVEAPAGLDGVDVSEWLEAPSVTARFGPPAGSPQ